MQLLAFRFALAGNSILVIFITVVGFAITPLKLFDPLWLAGFSEVMINNTFMAVVGLSFISLSCYFDPSNPTLLSHQSRLAKLCFAVVLGFVLLIPLQFYVANRTVTALQRKELYQYEATSRQIKFLAQKIQQATTFDQLQAVMKAYQAFEIPESERAKPLDSLKRFLLTETNQALVMVRNRRRPDLIISSTWQSYKSAIRNTIYSLAYILVFASFAQRRQSENSWLQEIMQGFLNRLYAVLEHRETRLATQSIQPGEPKESLPLSQEQLISLHRQGLIDQAWIPDQNDQEANVEPSLTDLDHHAASDSDPLLTASPRSSGLFSWLRSSERRRRDEPMSFLQSLAGQQDSDQEPATNPEAIQSNSSSSMQDEPKNSQFPFGQQRSGGSPPRNQRITDLDYFEQLADEHQDRQTPPTSDKMPPSSKPK